MKIAAVSFWLSAFMLFYIYAGYYLALRLCASLAPRPRRRQQEDALLFASVIVSAYNEAKSMGDRIKNLLSLDYPKERLDIIVASDGSKDDTVQRAQGFEGVRVLDFRENRGKALVHNDAVKEAKGEIIVFTDADTVFEKDFLREIVKPFGDQFVGCATGNLVYKPGGTAVSESEGLYWGFEKKLRTLESGLGMLATATGACMAVRKSLWKDLSPIDDSDFTTPLDVALAGMRTVHVQGAIAYDLSPSTIRGEFRTRVRQTSKNFIGTLRRWGLRGCVQRPLVSMGLLSHKILRWLTPFFMLALFVSNMFLLGHGAAYAAMFIGQAVFYKLAATGLVAGLYGKKIPIASTAASFCVANAGMATGVVKGMAGMAPSSFKKAE